MNTNTNDTRQIPAFTRYAGRRPLAETTIDDIPLPEQSAYWKCIGLNESEEYTDGEADKIYAAWMLVQLSYLNGRQSPELMTKAEKEAWAASNGIEFKQEFAYGGLYLWRSSVNESCWIGYFDSRDAALDRAIECGGTFGGAIAAKSAAEHDRVAVSTRSLAHIDREIARLKAARSKLLNERRAVINLASHDEIALGQPGKLITLDGVLISGRNDIVYGLAGLISARRHPDGSLQLELKETVLAHDSVLASRDENGEVEYLTVSGEIVPESRIKLISADA